MRATPIKHIQYAIPPEANTPMYVWHKFFGRKPWNIVSNYIEHYCPQNGIVIDPFAGSGVTVMEALKLGRKVIAIDINPVATAIIKATIEPIAIQRIITGFKAVENKVKTKILQHYTSRCRKCGKPIHITAAVYKRVRNSLLLEDVRYQCPTCGHKAPKNTLPTREDKKLVAGIPAILASSGYWYPDNKLYYNGRPFKEKQQYESIDELFTPRNLLCLAILMDAIEDEVDPKVRFFLKMAFSSMVHLCSTMMPVRETRDLSGCWTLHSYWYANRFLEQNVWKKFESSVMGRQGLVKAKEESNRYFEHVRIAKTIHDIFRGKADVFIATDSAQGILTLLQHNGHRVHYCFTDPPYNASIQYGELCYMWASWLKMDENYLKTMVDNEIIENSCQKKDCQTYHAMLRSSLTGIYTVLQPGAFCHLTFHNPQNKYRNMLLNSAMYAGFEFEEVHHQEGARQSAKSLLQPFGSVTGDLYFRFLRNIHSSIIDNEELSEQRFETIVIQTALKVIIARGEPTPYTSIIEEMDKELYKEGFYTETCTKFDVQDVLKKALGKYLTLVNAKIGKTFGKLWWLARSSDLRKVKIPLDERVEAVIVDLLKQHYEVSFTEVWEKIATSFPNSLTPDTSNIRRTLEEYAVQTTAGKWRIKPVVREYVSQHSKMISMLAQIGRHRGYKIHIGMKEQQDILNLGGRTTRLRELCTEIKPKFKDISDNALKHINNIDVYWYKNNKIYYCFEVENTTSITSALERVSAIPYDTENFMVLPEERRAKIKVKLGIPVFADAFKKHRWEIIYYNGLMQNYRGLMKDKRSLGSIIVKSRKLGSRRSARYEKHNAYKHLIKPIH
ncbi:MAG: DNA methyltransferase [Pseudomonadota bacterium]